MSKKCFLSNIILFVSGAVSILLIILSAVKIGHLNATSQAITSVNQTLEANRAKLSRLKELEKVRPELEFVFLALNELLPQNAEENELISQIQKLSSANGVEIIQLEFLDRNEDHTITEMPFKLTVKGKYTAMVQFTDRLSSGKRLVRIEQINISREDDTLSLVKADISAAAFFNSLLESTK